MSYLHKFAINELTIVILNVLIIDSLKVQKVTNVVLLDLLEKLHRLREECELLM